MPRKLKYGVDGKAANLQTVALDAPGHGGACHVYQIAHVAANGHEPLCDIKFQDGPVHADGDGINGVQNEDLLAVVVDRLQGFQSGDYACRENSIALTKIQEALHWLEHRTRARVARGVEGTHAV